VDFLQLLMTETKR